MGTDVYAQVQVRINGEWMDHPLDVFDGRNYALFGWLADVRNYSAVVPLAQPKGPPDDFQGDFLTDLHSVSWFHADELAAVDFDATVEDRRTSEEVSPGFTIGNLTAEAGKGETMPLRDFLGEHAVRDIGKIVHLGDARVVFGFSS
jgi:hypothetical protein